MGIGTSADGSSSLSLLAAVRKFVAAGCVAPPGADGTPMIFDDSRCLLLCFWSSRLREYYCEECTFFVFCFFWSKKKKKEVKEARENFFFVFFWL